MNDHCGYDCGADEPKEEKKIDLAHGKNIYRVSVQVYGDNNEEAIDHAKWCVDRRNVSITKIIEERR